MTQPQDKRSKDKDWRFHSGLFCLGPFIFWQIVPATGEGFIFASFWLQNHYWFTISVRIRDDQGQAFLLYWLGKRLCQVTPTLFSNSFPIKHFIHVKIVNALIFLGVHFLCIFRRDSLASFILLRIFLFLLWPFRQKRPLMRSRRRAFAVKRGRNLGEEESTSMQGSS